jgi:beta-N-acetylhexosaminidase
VIGSELQAHGVDFSFAPVLDVDYGESSVIGDRALHSDPNVIAVLAEALQAGLNAAGMMSVGKHFPGLGAAVIDSHSELPTIDRSRDEILKYEVAPYTELFSKINARLNAVIIAHGHYPAFDGPAPLPSSPPTADSIFP